MWWHNLVFQPYLICGILLTLLAKECQCDDNNGQCTVGAENELECSRSKQKCIDLSKNIGKDEASIIYKPMRGRLGNRINGYATMQEFQRSHGYRAFIDRETYDLLTGVFDPKSIEIPILEDSICDPGAAKYQVYTGNFTKLILHDSELKKGHILKIYPPDKEGKKLFK